MVYRIDFQNFLIYAIDYLTLEELTSFQYGIISAKLPSGGRLTNVVKLDLLYPDRNIIEEYSETHNRDLFEKKYLHTLKDGDENGKTNKYGGYINRFIYNSIIVPLLNHYNIMLICDRIENEYLDILCKYLKEEYSVEVIDLNVLFTKGRIGPIHIDRDKIRDRAVDIRREAVRDEIKSLSSTREGKEKLIAKMSDKQKKKYLKQFGIKITDNDKKDIDHILLEAWCDEDEE